MGSGLAIPHGTNEAKSSIRRTAISFVRYPSGIDWNGHQVKFVVGIAGAGNEHLPLLGKIAKVFADSAKVAELEEARTVEDVQRILGQVSNADAGA
jgi:PTS system mannitol-specific IIC component